MIATLPWSRRWRVRSPSTVADSTQTFKISADRLDNSMSMKTDRTLAFSRLPRCACALQWAGGSVRTGSFPWKEQIDGSLA